jgi:hypothetical protein
MEALMNATSLLDFLLEYKETIAQLSLDDKVKLSHGVLLVGTTCHILGLNIDAKYRLDEVLTKARSNADLVADSLNTFTKRNVAEALSDVFSVKTNIEQYVAGCTEDQRKEFASKLRELAKAYNSFVTACLAIS